MEEYLTKSLTLATIFKMIGFQYSEMWDTGDGVYVFRYYVPKEDKEEMLKWADMYYSNTVLVPPDKFIIHYKELKNLIYDKSKEKSTQI